MIAITGWLISNWRLVALGASLAAVLGFVALSLHWHKEAVLARSELAAAQKQVSTLTTQIKTQAVEQGKRYADLETACRASAGAAYDAGARKLRDDKAIASGRYLPRASSGHAKR